MLPTVQVKTITLTGAALDFAVATAAGYQDIRVYGKSRPTDCGWIEVRFNPEPKAATARYNPSESWGFAGPIMKLADISVIRAADEYGVDSEGFCDNTRIPIWAAVMGQQSTIGFTDHQHHAPMFQIEESEVVYARCPLVAAMRCFVLIRKGEEVAIPTSLWSEV